MSSAILIVDDNKLNLKLLHATLSASDYRPVEAADGIEALAALEREPIQAVISDAMMPRMDGFTLCAEMRAQRRFDHIPFVLYTSTYTQSQDEHLAMALGADRFMKKPARPVEIVRTIQELTTKCPPRDQAVIASAGDLSIFRRYSDTVTAKLEQRNAELMQQSAKIRASDARLRGILEAEPDAVQVIGNDGATVEINRAGLELYEVAVAEEMSRRSLLSWADPQYRPGLQAALSRGWKGEKTSVEYEMTTARGTRRWLEMHTAPLLDAEGHISAILGISRDLTERKALEAQFVQAQKMEVIGQFSGGVTHDFNNLLAVVMGCAEVLQDGLANDPAMREYATIIMQTAERAAALTRQLLLFSRKQTEQRETIDLSELITGVDPMLHRILGEPIKLVTGPEADLFPVEADPGQLEQVLLNLCINARDAMPDGGTIQITTGNFQRGEKGPLAELPPGDYACLKVTDNGHGMTPEVQRQIFEPFFTTKPPGIGTGLGLATCQTIVQRWGGRIAVESAVGEGATFSIFLPRATGALPTPSRLQVDGPLPRGKESILLVEDEPGLLDLAAHILSRQGFEMLKAANGVEAMRIVRERGEKRIDLVVTDMVMPKMGGLALANELRQHWPDVRILFTSGYTDSDLSAEAAQGRLHFLPKPYTPSLLIRKVREVLDEPTPSAS